MMLLRTLQQRFAEAPLWPAVLVPLQVGRQEPVMVLRVDKEKGYIDLSKRRVSPEDLAVS